MPTLISLLNNPIFGALGAIGILYSLVTLIATGYLWAKGIIPVWWRLGIGLSKRRIAIFAEDEFDNLKNVLVDSKLFQESNIKRIDKSSIKKAEGWTLLLVHWATFQNEIDEIMNIKKDSCALVVYAPPNEGRVPDNVMAKINHERNSILVNFRGRLLNDILTCMITTAFEES